MGQKSREKKERRKKEKNSQDPITSTGNTLPSSRNDNGLSLALGERRISFPWWAQLFFLAIVVLLTYSHTLDVPLDFDDIGSIKRNAAIQDPSLQKLWAFSPLRIVGYLSFAINYQWHQLDVGGYHVVNILIHFLAGCAVFALSSGLLQTKTIAERFGSPSTKWFPLLAALLFIVHPLQTQAITYIVQRLASLAALFYISSMACYIQARNHEEPAGKWFWAGCTAFMAGLAFFTKQNSATLPFALILLEAVFFPGNFKRLARVAIVTGTTLCGIYLVSTFAFNYAPFSLQAMDALTKETSVISRSDYLATQTYVLWSYIRMFFFPTGLHLDHSVVLAQGFLSLPVIIALTAHLTAIASALYLRKKVPVVAFAILFYYLAHMVESSVIPIRDVMFEHRTYLPNVGLCLCISWLISRFLANRKEKMIAALSIILLIIALGVTSWNRNNVWRDNVALWKDNLAKSGHTRRPLYNLANALHKQEKLDAAASYYLETLQLDPAYAKAHNGLGIVYAKQGKFKEAEGHFLEASRLNPGFAQAHNSLGILYVKQGSMEKAIFHFKQALAVKPDYRIARANLEAALHQLNRSRQ